MATRRPASQQAVRLPPPSPNPVRSACLEPVWLDLPVLFVGACSRSIPVSTLPFWDFKTGKTPKERSLGAFILAATGSILNRRARVLLCSLDWRRALCRGGYLLKEASMLLYWTAAKWPISSLISRNFSQQNLTIGLDLGDRSSHYCVLDESGGILVESKVSHEPQCDAGGVRVDAAESHCFGDGDALPVGKPAAERIGARSDRGPCTQRALDRGEPAQRRSPGCADSGSSGADR